MNNPKRKAGPDTDLRSLLKHQHKKVYSICRFFANNYKEHQRLFIDIIAAASQNIRFSKGKCEKHTLLLRACINMAALHSIRLDLEPAANREIHFKSPDFQRNMTQFRESVGDVSDLAIRLPCEPSGGTRSGIYVGVFGSCGTEVDAGEGRR